MKLNFLFLLLVGVFPLYGQEAKEVKRERAWQKKRVQALASAVTGGITAALINSSSPHKGARGPRGHRGAPGPKEKFGKMGPQGSKGARGERGEQGPEGDPGEIGLQGLPAPSPFQAESDHVLIFQCKLIPPLSMAFDLVLLQPDGTSAAKNQMDETTYQWTVLSPLYGAYHLLFDYTYTGNDAICVDLETSVFMSREGLEQIHLTEPTSRPLLPGSHQWSYTFIYSHLKE